MFKAAIRITLRPSILDPQGKATEHALESLGFTGVASVRMGKYVEMMIEADDQAAAETIADEACAKLLANPVMEDYTVTVEAVTPAAA